MDFHIFLAVILAGILHASWNLIVKLDLDPVRGKPRPLGRGRIARTA
jgi:hypothetical protein